MPKYIVEVKELWIQEVMIEAADEQEAAEKVANGEGDFVGLADGEKIPERKGFEFQYSLDCDVWDVRKVE